MLGSLFLLWLTFCLLFFLLRTRRAKNFPPGPQPVPIFGNLLQLNLENPTADLERLSARYGKVFSLYFGGRPAVILNGTKAMREALVTKATDFAGRPGGLLLSHLTQGKGVIMADHGPSWREHRRFALMTLRNFGLGKQSMEQRILGEVEHVAAVLEKSIGKSVDPQTLFHNASCDIICSIMFGARYDYEHEFFQAMIKMMADNSKIANGPWGMIYDTMPLLRSLPLPFQNPLKAYCTVKHHVLGIVEEHRASRSPNQPRDVIDSYLDQMDKRKAEEDSLFNEDQMVVMLLDLLFAGTDTTSNTIRFAVLYLMTHPDIQERCQREIDRVLEGKDQASFEDRHKMPYTQAVIQETQRIASTLPLSVFHCTTKDTELMGYHIPKGTLVIPNLTSVLHEEGQWKFPHEFNPDNFLNEQGELLKLEAFMPFSVGPRMCLGEGLARMELFLILVTLLRRFQFVWPEDAGQPDYTPVFGVTQAPKPYSMMVRLRESQQG
ncbi:cytochrome P450 2F2-like [Myripristis murdjan]|uniref:Cytochrome P450 2F2-like n=1 Tax=Myripristis murdjan TaxID=586833 RepID=A0A667XUT5_9TELE|nr:cytochrome P450 2F2-like [Myripristis murdjan]